MKRAFTLIELLLAMTLLAIISSGMVMAFSTSLRAAASIRQRAATADEQRALIDQLRADLQGVYLRPGATTASPAAATGTAAAGTAAAGGPTTWFRGGDLSTDPNDVASATTAGEAIPAMGDSLELTTARPVSLDALQAGAAAEGTFGPQSDLAQVSWRLERDPDGATVLVRRERTPPDPSLDVTQDPSVLRAVMSRSVTSMQVFCYDSTQQQWLEQWDAALPLSESAGGSAPGSTAAASASAPAGLPQAVQVLLTLARADKGGAPVQPSASDRPLSVIVAMPGAQAQLLQEELQQNTGSAGG